MAENKIITTVKDHPVETALIVGATTFVIGCIFGGKIAKVGNLKVITTAVQNAIEGMSVEILPIATADAANVAGMAAIPEEAAAVAEAVADVASVAA